MKKVTAQQFFEAYKQTLEVSPDILPSFRVLPERWEDVCKEDKALFYLMAWKLNLITAEFAKQNGR